MRRLPAGAAALAVLVACAAYIGAVVIPDALSTAPSEPCSPTSANTPGFKAVFLSTPSLPRAQSLQLIAQQRGFTGVAIEQPSCGRYELVLRNIPTEAVGREFAQEAETAGLHVDIADG